MRVCKIEGCKNRHEARGYCKKHYIRFRRYGNPLYTKLKRYPENHGMRYSSEYTVYRNMIRRCYEEDNISCKYYSNRRIIVCDRWLKSFKMFYDDMGSKPFSKAQIDRIDNNGNYTPQNCRWTTAAKNNQNKSSTKLTMKKARAIRREYRLSNISQRELALKYRVSHCTINYIIKDKTWKEIDTSIL
jgi:hypothetical protein